MRFLPVLLSIPGLLAGQIDSRTQSEYSAKVYVALSDPQAHAIRPSSLPAFQLKIDGVEVSSFGVEPAVDPLSVVVVLEGMGAVETTRLRKASHGLVSSIRQQNPQSRVGLMLVPGPKFPVMRRAAADASEIDKTVSTFLGADQTAPLLESILVATRALATEQSSRRIVVALAAGVESNHGVSAPKQVLDELRRAGVSLWSIDLGWDALTIGPAEGKVLAAASAQSGGIHAFANSTSFDRVIQELLNLIYSQYVITYRRPSGLSQSSRLQVGVRTDDGVRVVAPTWVSDIR
jgi:hypothetical protein